VAHPLDNLEPKQLWKHFKAVSDIPRCSGNEEKAAEYILSEARRLGLDHHQDRAGNIVVRQQATRGKEGSPITVLQGHIDMVCEKNEGTEHDFSKDPIRLIRDGDIIRADGTTLGADNGIGVAAALAVMESEDISHGPLEYLFTVDEESGLTGAADLSNNMLQGRHMVNMDSEEVSAVYIGCSGGLGSTASKKVSLVKPSGGKRCYRLKVTGLKGGHSGLDIHLGRGNAIKLLARILWTFSFGYEMEIAVLEGGNKRNAIPREASAVFFMNPNNLEGLKRDMAQIQGKFRSELGPVDPDASIVVDAASEPPEMVINKIDARAVVNFLCSVPQGVMAMSPDMPGLVQTSTNTAVLETRGDIVVVQLSHRSSVESSKRDLGNMMASFCELSHFALEQGAGYPGWQPNVNSPLLAKAKAVHQRLFDREPTVTALHAGLECGLIGEKFPGMDMISIGPAIASPHSPDERVDIASVEQFWTFLQGILEAM